MPLLRILRSVDDSELSRLPRSTDVEGRRYKKYCTKCCEVLMLWCAPIGSRRAVKRAWHHTDESWLPLPAHGHIKYFAKPLERKILPSTSKHADDSPSTLPRGREPKGEGVSLFYLWLPILLCPSVRVDVTIEY